MIMRRKTKFARVINKRDSCKSPVTKYTGPKLRARSVTNKDSKISVPRLPRQLIKAKAGCDTLIKQSNSCEPLVIIQDLFAKNYSKCRRSSRLASVNSNKKTKSTQVHKVESKMNSVLKTSSENAASQRKKQGLSLKKQVKILEIDNKNGESDSSDDMENNHNLKLSVNEDGVNGTIEDSQKHVETDEHRTEKPDTIDKNQQSFMENSDNFFHMLSTITENGPSEKNNSDSSDLFSTSSKGTKNIEEIYPNDNSNESFYGDLIKNPLTQKDPKTKKRSNIFNEEENDVELKRRKVTEVLENEDKDYSPEASKENELDINENESIHGQNSAVDNLFTASGNNESVEDQDKDQLDSGNKSSNIVVLSNHIVYSPEKKANPLEDSQQENDTDQELSSSSTESKQPKVRKVRNVSMVLPISWPAEDLEELLQRVENTLPEIDKKHFIKRFKDIVWENIAFKSYTPIECKNVFKMLQKKVRSYRILKEIVTDCKEILKKVKIKEKTNAELPKRPLTDFMFYYKEVYPTLKKQHPGLTSAQISQKISSNYWSLSEEERRALLLRKQKYLRNYYYNIKEYYLNNPKAVPFQRANKVAKNIIKNDPPPELPQKPFKLFYKKEIEKHQDFSDEFKDNCRRRWYELEDHEKIEYLEETDELLKNYKNDLEKYCERYPLYKPPVLKPIFTRKEEKLLKDFNKPKKPPHSGYLVYYQSMCKEKALENLKGQERKTVLENQWTTYTDEQRLVYTVRKDQLWERYALELEEYVKKFPAYKRDFIRKKELKGNKKILEKVLAASVDNVSKRKFKEKIDKEPQMPPTSTYSYFLTKCKDDDPKKAWKNLSSSEKEQYKKQLDKLKRRYIREFEEFLKGMDADELEEYARTKA